MSKFKGNYPPSENGNFKIIDSIGVPHPYCVTGKHVAYAADHCCGMLSNDAIREAEKHGAKCDICRRAGKILTIDEHQQALLVECKADVTSAAEELKTWLLSIKDETVKNGYVGFAFIRAKELQRQNENPS